jgi:hypothetical protein
MYQQLLYEVILSHILPHCNIDTRVSFHVLPGKVSIPPALRDALESMLKNCGRTRRAMFRIKEKVMIYFFFNGTGKKCVLEACADYYCVTLYDSWAYGIPLLLRKRVPRLTLAS